MAKLFLEQALAFPGSAKNVLLVSVKVKRTALDGDKDVIDWSL